MKKKLRIFKNFRLQYILYLYKQYVKMSGIVDDYFGNYKEKTKLILHKLRKFYRNFDV